MSSSAASDKSRPHRPAGRRLRILLTGSSGQVGWELRRTLAPLGEVVLAGRQPTGGAEQAVVVDLADKDQLRRAVREVQPDLIVNPAAYTAVDKAETEPERAMAINAVAPGVLAEEALRLGAALVHYSTDYVFDGSGLAPWREADPTGPLNVYGQTKLAGEAAVQAVAPAHLILRTSWVYGLHGANFVKTMLRLGAEKTSLAVVADQVGAPTSARVIAETTALILAQGLSDLAGFLQERGGVVHLACGGETSWHGLAVASFELARQAGLPLAVCEVRPIASADYPTPARRPKNSRLDCTRLAERFGLVPPDWRMALEQSFPGRLLPAAAPTAPIEPAGERGAQEARRPQVGSAGPQEASSPETSRAASENRPATSALAPLGLVSRPADLDIGVIYTHERQHMDRLLTTLAASGNDLRMRLVLVDNASEEGVAEWEHVFPETTVLRNDERLGYAANLNRILDAATAPYVLLMNTDMYFEPAEQSLSKMVRFMRRQPDCGLSGCRLYHPDGTYAYPARRFQTLRVIAARRAGLGRFLPKTLDGYLYQERDPQETFACDWLSGCFLLVRRAAMEEVGRFDCGFAKYFEDVDICLRMARAGWRVMFHGETYAFHVEQRASKTLLSRDALEHARSYLRWLRKWGLDPQREARPSGGNRPARRLLRQAG